MSHPSRLIALILAVLGTAAGTAGAEDAAERPWKDTADVSVILTSGNSQTKNFAASNKFVYTWSNADFTLFAGALRTSSTDRTAANVGGALQIIETSKTTAESYLLDAKYRRTIREGFLWYVNGGWNRNRPSGIDGRLYAGGGIGYRFVKTEKDLLVGELGVDYTSQEYVGGGDDAFAGARAYLGYERAISKTSKYNSDLEILENLKDTSDLRGKWVNAVTASLTSKLALKASLSLLYDRQPVVQRLFDPADPTGIVIPAVDFEFDELDTVLAASLVINF